MSSSSSPLIIREYPLTAWVVGILGTAYVAYKSFQNTAPWMPFLAVAIGLWTVFGPTINTLSADRATGLLRLIRWAPFRKQVREIPLDEVVWVYVDRKTSQDEDGFTYLYRTFIQLADGTEIGLEPSYASGSYKRVKCTQKAEKLRAYLGLKETNAQRRPHTKEDVYFLEQQRHLTGDPEQIHETEGIRWQFQPYLKGSLQVNRWHTRKPSWNDGFIYLLQNIEGVIGLRSNKALRYLAPSALRHSTQLYGFTAMDLPGLNKAQLLETLTPPLETHFTVLTSRPEQAARLLNHPWVAAPLIRWIERHPCTRQNAIEQLVVAYGASGLYLAVQGLVGPQRLKDLTYLGVDLARALESVNR